MWVREDEVEQQVLEILDSLAIKDADYLKDIISWIRSTHDTKKTHHKNILPHLKKSTQK